jgi:hypothetical protein
MHALRDGRSNNRAMHSKPRRGAAPRALACDERKSLAGPRSLFGDRLPPRAAHRSNVVPTLR